MVFPLRNCYDTEEEKMKSQKYLMLVSLLVILALVLSGCAQATEAPEPTEPLEVAPTEPPAEEVVEIIYMRFVEESDMITTLVEEFNASHPNIKVIEDKVPAEDAYPKLVLTTEAGDPPDVFETYFTLGAATNGLALDVSPFIDKEGTDWFESLSENGWIFHAYAGGYYAVPYRVAPGMVFLNTNLLEKAGLDVPLDWTWDDFLDYAQAMTNPDEEEYGFCIMGSAEDPGTDYQYYPFLFQAGGKMIDENGLAGFDSPEGAEALQFMADMINVYKVTPPGTTSATANVCIELLAADKVGMWTNASLWRGFIRGQFPDVALTLAPMPTHTKAGTLVGGTGLGISPLSENQEAAWEFVKFMVDDPNIRRWALAGGFEPPNISLLEDPTYTAEDPEVEIVGYAMLNQTMYPLSHYPENFDIESILRSYMQAVYLEEMTAEDALAEAAAQWDLVLEKYVADEWWDAWLR
jgi:multiple sugar transport system substrate-binding protein